MIHLSDLTAVQLQQPSVVTIGVFDGVHRGHHYLLRKLVDEAHATGRVPVVVTFYPHPDVVLRGISGRYYLAHPDERARMMGALGVEYVITLRFDESLRQMRAAAFTSALVDNLHVEALWVGADFALGYKREGDVPFLRAQGDVRGFEVHVIDLLMADAGDEGAISSTAIREALGRGDVEHAREWLGGGYRVSGEVVKGQQRGRTIGYPTANIAVWSEQIIPANGVYAGWATLETGERFMAVTNVGVRPTFDGVGVTVEAHLLDFDRDLYGQILTFSFESRLRAEMRFSGIDALIVQITADAAAGRLLLEKAV
ncbi:MAG: bifunctional riboflavin kinase/FAD synthetase [Chloroflexota bacterium]|nr:bifunctional riboflavin kinase/FAD synthetase [Chloroflexota bacterium]